MLRLGLAGLGTASRQILPDAAHAEGVQFAAVADVRPEALAAARRDYPGIATFESVEEMARSSEVDVIWIATPNELHARHAIAAAEGGKHVIGEKPMAITLAECDSMVEAFRDNGVKYVQGHSKLHGIAVRALGQLALSGDYGRVLEIASYNSNDWMRRPRLESEFDVTRGGGILYRQGPHQLDIVRYLGGGVVTSVTGTVGRHPRWPATDGNYTAFLTFENGAIATASLNGYGNFDAAELTWDIGEGGKKKVPADRRPAVGIPEGPVSPTEKYAWADSARLGGGRDADPTRTDETYQAFFGLTIVTCERATFRQSPQGVFVYEDGVRRELPVPPALGHAAELWELRRAIDSGDDAFPGAEWGRATVALCLSLMESSATKRAVTPPAQVPVPEKVSLHAGTAPGEGWEKEPG